MRASAQLLREVPDLADGKGGKGRVILVIVFPRKPVLGAEIIIDVPIHLIGFESRVRPDDQHVISERLIDRGIFRRDKELTIGQLEVHDVLRDLIDVACGQTRVCRSLRRTAGRIESRIR